MSETYYTRIKDPLRLIPGDLIVFPATKLLKISKPESWRKLGVSLGTTARSNNDPMIVKTWLCRDSNDTQARVFMVLCSYGSSVDKYNSELMTFVGLEATDTREVDTHPRVRSVRLVPFGLPIPDWASGTGDTDYWAEADWMGAWDTATKDLLSNTLLTKVGARGCISDMSILGEPDKNLNQFAEVALDSVGLIAHNYNLPDVPRTHNNTSRVTDFRKAYKAINVGKFAYSKNSLLLTRDALNKLSCRGIIAFRPTPTLIDYLNKVYFSKVCSTLADMFKVRRGYIKDFIKYLTKDMKSEEDKVKLYTSMTRSAKADRNAVKALERIIHT